MTKKNSRVSKLIALLEKISSSQEAEKKTIKIIKKWYQQQKATQALVISAIKLKKAQLGLIEKKLSQAWQKPVKVVNKIDKNILGGLKIIIDSKIIDASIKSQLNKILTH